MYNPSAAGQKGTIFGLPYKAEEADLVLLPVHMDVTVSYADGTAKSPATILEESSQLDLSLLSIHNPWELKMAIVKGVGVHSENEKHRELAKGVIDNLESGFEPNPNHVNQINDYCSSFHYGVEENCNRLLDNNKIVGIIGGDHSSPLGLMRALAKKDGFGILQIDAHMDLRNAYEGFQYSHASIMYNALKEEGISSLTQVGIRDFCEEEEKFIGQSQKDIHVFFDETLFNGKMGEISWLKLVDEITSTLPQNVYISFDVDGLDPSLCPNTGTPVPGGLNFNEAVLLIEAVVRSGRKIIGFDLCETGNDAWDANVSARILFRLATALGVSNGLLKFRKLDLH